jgi:hypothetical protein
VSTIREPSVRVPSVGVPSIRVSSVGVSVFEGAYSSVTHLASAVLPVRRSTERLAMQYVLDNTRMSASVCTYEQMVCRLDCGARIPLGSS